MTAWSDEIEAGELENCFYISLLDDDTEGNRNFVVSLLLPPETPAILGPIASTTVFITDDLDGSTDGSATDGPDAGDMCTHNFNSESSLKLGPWKYC